MFKINLLTALFLTIVSSCKAQNNLENMEQNATLHYIVRESSDSIVKSPMLLLLHGHGSNENDLFSLSENIPNDWIVISVRGSYKLTENSYRWYDVKMVNGKISINIEEEEKSRKLIIDLISELTNKYNVDTNNIIVAGFSQGANMAQSLGLCNPDLVAGFAVFSGRYVEEITPFISKSPILKNRKAYIAHGSGDQMLPKTYAEENLIKLKEFGVNANYCEDLGGHSISAKQWSEFVTWLTTFTR